MVSVFLILCGIFVDGTYAIITTAVSSDLVSPFDVKLYFTVQRAASFMQSYSFNIDNNV